MKKIYLFVPLFLIFVVVFTALTPVAAASEDISSKVFRLHIIANSDTTEDQELKLKVRDRILEKSKDIYSECGNVYDAINASQENENELRNIAQKTVCFYGYTYPVKVYVTKEFFNVREYDSFTLPAGMYNCLKVVIGEGKGKNWWCVMFPQVCLSGCTDDIENYLTDEEKQMITDNYKVRFKVLEVYERIKYKITKI